MPTVEGRSVTFLEAVEALRQRVPMPTRAWTDLWEGQHARAFVVAGAMQADLVSAFKVEVGKALAEGTTLAMFRKQFDSIVDRFGWAHTGSRGFRSKVIFETNMRTSYAAGRWRQIESNAEAFPWLRYTATLDNRTRPQHRRWHGLILPWDDPFWKTHFPPNGWGCRCSVIPLSQRQLDRRGWTPGQSPQIERVRQTITINGERVSVSHPEGVDPGFAYNAGVAAWGKPSQELALRAHGPWKPMTPPRPDIPPITPTTPSATLGVRVSKGDTRALRDAFREAMGGSDAVTMRDPFGLMVRATEAIPEHVMGSRDLWNGGEALWPLIPEAITNPSEVLIGFHGTDASSIRRRYVKAFQLGGSSIALVVDVDRGLISGVTVAAHGTAELERLRSGGQRIGGV